MVATGDWLTIRMLVHHAGKTRDLGLCLYPHCFHIRRQDLDGRLTIPKNHEPYESEKFHPRKLCKKHARECKAIEVDCVVNDALDFQGVRDGVVGLGKRRRRYDSRITLLHLVDVFCSLWLISRYVVHG